MRKRVREEDGSSEEDLTSVLKTTTKRCKLPSNGHNNGFGTDEPRAGNNGVCAVCDSSGVGQSSVGTAINVFTFGGRPPFLTRRRPGREMRLEHCCKKCGRPYSPTTSVATTTLSQSAYCTMSDDSERCGLLEEEEEDEEEMEELREQISSASILREVAAANAAADTCDAG